MIEIGKPKFIAAVVLSLIIAGVVGGSAEHTTAFAQAGKVPGGAKTPARTGQAQDPNLPQTPREIVKVRGEEGTPFFVLAKRFNRNSLPEFFAILEDDGANGSELMNTLGYIYQLNSKNDEKAVEKLLAFIKRPVDWSKWRQEKNATLDIVAAKSQALETIGFIGGEDAERILKSALTMEGAKELSRAWLPGFPESGFKHQSVLDNMRGMAANGLAYSKKPATRKLVEAEYENEKLRLKNPGQTATYYSSQLVDSMVKMDLVKEIGLEGHAALYDGENSYRKAYREKLPTFKLD